MQYLVDVREDVKRGNINWNIIYVIYDARVLIQVVA